jgi:hypothetical protein
MNTLKKWTCLLYFLPLCSFGYAQQGLNIEQIFRDYGKKEGSVLIELAKDVLGNHTKLNRYKSLIILSDSIVLDATRKAVQTDFDHKGGSIIRKSLKDGKLIETTYCLKKNKPSQDYEYILFTAKEDKITLVYLRGKFSPDRLTDELQNLKNLLIEVNNKQLKLQ